MRRKLILILLFPFFFLCGQSNIPDDQLLVIFGSSGYAIYKVLDFANDHGYRYIKILSYEFNGFDHSISGICKGDRGHGGRYFELKDENITIAFLCFEEAPQDIYIIDVEKYRNLLEDVRAAENLN